MIPAFPVYLFDVDGTLLDSAPDICGAIAQVLAARGRADVSDAYLRGFIGRHLIDLFSELGFAATDMDGLIAEYRQIYWSREHSSTRIYPGVVETLARLGGRKSTATTKSTDGTRMVLEKFGLRAHFDHLQGTDGFPAKPAPDVILKSIEALDARPEDCLLVGDAAADMEAGRRAGVKLCAVTYGYGQRDEMARFSPDYWISDPRELVTGD